MQLKNSILMGLLVGLLLPAVAWVLFGRLNPNTVILNKPAIPYLIALGLNLFIVKLCFQRNADITGKGVMLATFASMLVMVLILKVKVS
jgi:hypothetical protein